MRALLDVVLIAMNLFVWILIIQAILSWLVAFGVINTQNQTVATIWRSLGALTEPVVGPVRRMLPQTGGIDFAPLVVIFLIFFAQRFIGYYIYPVVP